MKKILVAISGGVDSSFSLHLLKKQGYQVEAVYFQLISIPKKKDKSYQNAESICKTLKIRLHVLDLKKQFKKQVIRYYINSYEQGNTPSPCVVCNDKIKFKYLIKLADKLDIKWIATGHYVKKINDQLYIAKDKNKDQSYFLWKLNPNIIKRVIFPLAVLTKKDVKKKVMKTKLVTNDGESQDVCFALGSSSDFLKKFAKELNAKGDIVDIKGNCLGKHSGLVNYTIGQKDGLGQIDHKNMCYIHKKSRVPKLYVVKLNVEKNQLIVGPKKLLYRKIINFKKSNWIAKDIKFPFECKAKIRSTSKIYNCKIIRKNKYLYTAIFSTKQLSVAIGQSIVFYKKNQLIGGGEITTD